MIMNQRTLLDDEVYIKAFHTVKGNAYNRMLFSYNPIFKNEVTIKVTDDNIIIKRSTIDNRAGRKASIVNRNTKYFNIGVTTNTIIPVGIYYISFDDGDELIINIERTKEEHLKQLNNEK
jgi:hypothetical protein